MLCPPAQDRTGYSLYLVPTSKGLFVYTPSGEVEYRKNPDGVEQIFFPIEFPGNVFLQIEPAGKIYYESGL